ncbi:MAG: ribonuclease P protein component [Microbacter sp.]
MMILKKKVPLYKIRATIKALIFSMNRMRQRYSLTKEERLRGVKNIQELFEQGQSILQYPIRAVYLLKKDGSGSFPKVLFSVPKRRFKKAHDRNLLRRRMKEAYRLHKDWAEPNAEHLLSEPLVAFTYIGNEPISFNEIEKAMLELLHRLKQRM